MQIVWKNVTFHGGVSRILTLTVNNGKMVLCITWDCSQTCV